MSNKMIFKQAKRLLFDSGKLLAAVLGFCVFLLAAVFPLIIADVVYLLLSYTALSENFLSLVLYVVLALFIVFVTMPVFFGYIRMLFSIAKQQHDVYVADIFDVFKEKKKYFRFVFYGIKFIFRAIFTLGLALFFAMFTYFFASEVFGENFIFIIKLITIIFSVFEFAFFYLLFSFARARSFLGVYYLVCGREHPYRCSKRALRTKMLRSFWVKLAFVGMALLSVLTIGSLFVVTMPIMTIAYYIYGNQFTENINE